MQLAHDRTGTGPPVVLLHGITHRRQAWDPVVPLLAGERELIAVDLPDHGDSDDLPADYAGDIGTLAAAVEDFAATEGLDRPHVVGNSLGGLVALELASRGTVASATAISPAGFWSPLERLWARGVLGGAHVAMGRMGDERVERILSTPAGRTALAGLILARPAEQDPAVLARDLGGLAHPRASFRAMLGALREWALPVPSAVPVTVGWGTRDLLLFRHQMRRLRRALPDADVYSLPGCGHVPMGDDPRMTADLIRHGSRPR